MAMIDVKGLTFGYEGSIDNIFENVSFQIDTDWKLGFIGRNGRGKTTFLNLLLGKHEYKGKIHSPSKFTYFPFEISQENTNTLEVIKEIIAPFKKMQDEMAMLLKDGSEQAIMAYSAIFDRFNDADGYIIEEMIEKEIALLELDTNVLKRPFATLSNGEKTKIMFAGLFLKKSNFLLIDEPTNHLDIEGRKLISKYLKGKKGFILVSHDRAFLDNIIDHVLTINKMNIEVQKGNYTSWQLNKDRTDSFEINKNQKLKKEITKLTEAARQTAAWSDKIESSKIGNHIYDRGFVGAQSARMMKRSKQTERRAEDALKEKKSLLQNIEQAEELKLRILDFHKERYIEAKDLCAGYKKMIFNNISFYVEKGDRLCIKGKNGCGKSTLVKLLLGEEHIHYKGIFQIPKGLKISYVSQSSSYLKGDLKTFAKENNIDENLFKAILRKLGFSRVQFEKDMADYSEGQKKKVLIAKSLSEEAHLYIWDEPLNYIDIISRIQIEKLILTFKPTIIFIEHDEKFTENIATKILEF